MDLRIRAFIHGYIQCLTILLRHVLLVQWRRQSICQLTRVLEILVRDPQA